MKKYVFVLMLFMLCSIFMPAQVHVTFRINMGAKVYNQSWNPAADSVTIRGTFQSDCGDFNSNWTGFYYKMSLIKDTIYGVTVTFPTSKIGTAYEYKFVIGPNTWEGTSNRSFTCPTKDSILSTYWFGDDSSHVQNNQVINTVTFTADISSILGTGNGYFDPSKDSLLVEGIEWDGHGTLISGNRKMTASNYIVGEYSTTLQVKGSLGDSCEWKFRAYPNGWLTNAGYETGNNRWYIFRTNGSTINIPVIVPVFVPAPAYLTSAVTTLFECNMNHSPVNCKNGKPIPVDSIYFVCMKGSHAALGAWGGNWTETDTLSPDPTMVVLHDDGFFGDRIAGDKIYSRIITFDAGQLAGNVQFKFGVSYHAADADAGGVAPLDNEGTSGCNHYFFLSDGKPTNVSLNFGEYFSVGINEKSPTLKRFSLAQNYPNPFNPATKIEYTVPGTGLVSLKIFDLLGKEVATLVNKEMTAGSYSADFNAAHLTSGIYFYKLTTGSNSIVKKMLLLK